ncbi:MAG: hypothetical protein M1835_002677, partial [Candelina submexicana]
MKPAAILSVFGLSALTVALPAIVERDASPSPRVPPDDGPSVPACWISLSCTFKEIEATSMSSRLDYVRYMQYAHFGPLKADNQFRAIEGVIEFFISEKLGAPGTWVSYVDAGIVEAIQRGGANALGLSTATGGNPGSEKWASFLTRRKNGGLTDRDDHDPAWSESEQTATEYGKLKAETTAGVSPATKEQLRWYQFTQLFRAIMRNRSKVILLIRATFIFTNPGLAFAAEAFIDWLTDITSDLPTRLGCEVAYTLSELDLPLGANLINDAKLLGALLPKLYKIYKEN